MSRKIILLYYCVVILLSFLITSSVFATDSMVSRVKVYKNMGEKISAEFLAFDKNFKGGGYVAMGNVTGNKKSEIIVGAGYGGGPQVRIFDKKGNSTGINFYAFKKKYKKGVSLAACNLDGGGKKEIVVGKALEDRSKIRIYRIKKNKEAKLLASFRAYSKDFAGGVNITCGDINGNGRDEIITGPGPGGRAHIRTFKFKPGKRSVKALNLSFFAFDEKFKGGATVGIGSLAKNKKKKVIVVGQASEGNEVELYKINKKKKKYSVKFVREIIAYDNFDGGVNLVVGNLDGKKKDEIVVAPAKDGGPQIKILNRKGKLKNSLMVYKKDFKGGVRLGVVGKTFVAIPGFKEMEKCEENCVALTFDDGYTSSNDSFGKILDVLEAKDAKATFFMVGKVMQRYPDKMKRIVNEGNLLANHSYSHPWFTRISEDQIKYELRYTDDIAYDLTGKRTKPFFRYPYGAHDSSTDAIIYKLGYRYYMWTATSGETRGSHTVQSVKNGMLNNLHDGSIILAHCSSDVVASVLGEVIDSIRNAGYNLVRLDQMKH